MFRIALLGGLIIGWTGIWDAASAAACPFCSGAARTLTEDLQATDVAIIARLIALPPAPAAPAGKTRQFVDDSLPKAKFEVVTVLKGESALEGVRTLETVYFGEAGKGKMFLIMGINPPNVNWSTPTALSESAPEYLASLLKLPRNGTERLEFFRAYLENADEMLARDAYDEFAKAPYAEVKALKEKLDHDQLVNWIKNYDISPSRRRLYLTMLGICGSADDTPLLEQIMTSEERAAKAGLDATIACYLLLKGPEGMPLVESLFLENPKAEYADTYAAIMALRFHGSEANVIPRERLLEGLRHILNRSQLADLVIPDLAKWSDWSQMDRLVQLFKDADENSWVRVPVINYLRACPLPVAAQRITELEKIDPQAVKRSATFFPDGPADGPLAKGPGKNST